MFGILFRVKTTPSKCKSFIKFIKWDARVAQKSEPGTLRFDLYQDPTDTNAFYVYEAYRDKAAFKKHQRNEPFKEWKSKVKPEMVSSLRHVFKHKALCALVRRRGEQGIQS